MLNKSLWIITLVLLTPNLVFADEILSYGFEDWSEYNEYASPADKYIYTSPDEASWDDHSESTIVTQGGVDCGGNTAQSGSYYHHVQFNTTTNDTCLGRTGSSVNTRDYIGSNYAYPTGTRDNTHFGTVMTGPIGVIRFYMRVTDDWTSTQTNIDNGGGMKFVRWAIGTDYVDDNNNVLIKVMNDSDDTYPRVGIFDPATTNTAYYTPSVNWQDSYWHSFSIKSVNNGGGSFTVSVYIDDWDMEDTPTAERDIDLVTPGNGYYYRCSMFGNWSAVYPVNLMGMDIDNIEVWNSIPSAGGITSVILSGVTIQ